MSDLIKRMSDAANKLGLPDEEAQSDGDRITKNEAPAWTKPTDKLLESADEYRRFESGYYFEDEEHFGTVFVSQKMVDKYNLDHTPILEWYEEKSHLEDNEEELAYLREMKEKWSQVIDIDHCWGYSETSDRYHKGYQSKTPHGEIGDEAFIAWWCDFPVEILKEGKEDVFVAGWADG